jgi:phospholipid/cholesterol/gamma-HCH transport system ATP-binding protein
VSTTRENENDSVNGVALDDGAADLPVNMIEVRGLRKGFGGREILKGVDLIIPRGTVCVVLGGSGMGKSVLMKHLIGLLQPDHGEVIIDGINLTKLNAVAMKNVRSKFGMVFQHAALFDSMTNFENVAFPLREHRKEIKPTELKEKVHQLFQLFSLDPAHIGPRFPSEISGGQRKRVSLARAVALDPSIVLYDEPTTGLDPITTDQVDEMILHAKKALNVTSLVISHDIASAFKIADQLLFVYEGEIVARGSKQDLLSSEHPFVMQFFATWREKHA